MLSKIEKNGKLSIVNFDDDDFVDPFLYDSSDNDDDRWAMNLDDEDSLPLLNVISFGWMEDGYG